jgi:hypothetical protein
MSLLHSFQLKRKARILTGNATTLLNQLDIALSVTTVYKSYYPLLDSVSALLMAEDRAILIAKLCGYCSKFGTFFLSLLEACYRGRATQK